jgi:hypothetical protein
LELQQVLPSGKLHVFEVASILPPTQAHNSSGAQQALRWLVSHTLVGSVHAVPAHPFPEESHLPGQQVFPHNVLLAGMQETTWGLVL